MLVSSSPKKFLLHTLPLDRRVKLSCKLSLIRSRRNFSTLMLTKSENFMTLTQVTFDLWPISRDYPCVRRAWNIHRPLEYSPCRVRRRISLNGQSPGMFRAHGVFHGFHVECASPNAPYVWPCLRPCLAGIAIPRMSAHIIRSFTVFSWFKTLKHVK